MRRHGLSKSKLTSYAQCPKRLWLQVHRPDAAEYDDGAEARFAAGHAIGDEACRQSSARHDEQGVMVGAEPTLAAALATTEDGPGKDGAGDTLHEYLSLDGTDPRRACAEALCRLPGTGAVIAYNAPFERGVIVKLAAAFPDLALMLESLAARLVDLLPVTRAHWYHRDQRGSWSIKAVLPTIAPAMDYAMLEVKHGGQAQEAWAEAAADGCTPERRAALETALRAYCGQDVEAMRVVARALVGETM